MLETEIKKLTAAVEANTAALLGASGGATVTGAPAPATPAPATAAPAAQPPAPATAAPAAPAAPAPVVQPPVTAAAPGTPVPGAPAAVQPMTHQQAQAELTAIVQQLGDSTQVQQTMVQYGSAQLNMIPVENLFALVQACKALLTS